MLYGPINRTFVLSQNHSAIVGVAAIKIYRRREEQGKINPAQMAGVIRKGWMVVSVIPHSNSPPLKKKVQIYQATMQCIWLSYAMHWYGDPNALSRTRSLSYTQNNNTVVSLDGDHV